MSRRHTVIISSIGLARTKFPYRVVPYLDRKVTGKLRFCKRRHFVVKEIAIFRFNIAVSTLQV